MLVQTTVVLALAIIASAAQPARLTIYPQKFRTFYSLDDAGVPQEVKAPADSLPVGDVTSIAVASDGAVWYGTRQGLVRIDSRAAKRDRYQYCGGKRYLPDDEVAQLAADSAGGMWVRTRTGVSHIELRPMTMAAKAEFFERRIRERHDRHGLVASSELRVPGDVRSNQMIDSDNDGLWTAIYAAAECFRYAVTKSP